MSSSLSGRLVLSFVALSILVAAAYLTPRLAAHDHGLVEQLTGRDLDGRPVILADASLHRSRRSFYRTSSSVVWSSDHWSFASGGATRLVARTDGGAIHVMAGPPDRIDVVTDVTAASDSPSSARTVQREARITRRRDGDRWVLEAHWPALDPRDGRTLSVSFDVYAPADLQVEAESGGGRVYVDGMSEAILRSSHGLADAQHVSHSVHARVTDGSIHVGECGGPVTADATNGHIEVHGVRGGITATTSNGAIDAKLNSGDTSATLEATNGWVDVRLPERLSARMTADAGNGGVTLYPGGNGDTTAGRTHVEQTFGGGAGTLRLRATNGIIRVRQVKAGEPAA